MRVDLLLGNGWYRGDLGFAGANANYGEEIAVAAVLEISYRGRLDAAPRDVAGLVGRDLGHPRNSLYNGQTIDARLRGAATPLAVRETDIDRSTLVPQSSPPVRRHETIRPARSGRRPRGRTLVDFGQNLVGWIRFTVQGPAGHRDRDPSRRGARGRRARHPAAARRRGDGRLRPLGR